MNREQFRQENQAIQRRYEKRYFPQVEKSIKKTIDETIAIVKDGGAQSAINHLNRQLSNTGLTEIVQKMALEVGSQFARRTWRSLQEQKRGAKPSKGYIMTESKLPGLEGSQIIKSSPRFRKENSINFSEQKGFGFNDIWISWIKRYLFDFIVQKITFSVFETTKDVLFKILSQAVAEGWGVDETVKALDELDLPKIQAARIVRTEITRAANAGSMAAGQTFPFEQNKEWISAHDTRVRGYKPSDHASHMGLDGNIVDYEGVFTDPRNGDKLRFPGDPLASAESTCNCRCSIAIVAKVDENGRLIPKQINQAA